MSCTCAPRSTVTSRVSPVLELERPIQLQAAAGKVDHDHLVDRPPPDGMDAPDLGRQSRLDPVAQTALHEYRQCSATRLPLCWPGARGE